MSESSYKFYVKKRTVNTKKTGERITYRCEIHKDGRPDYSESFDTQAEAKIWGGDECTDLRRGIAREVINDSGSTKTLRGMASH